MKRDPVRKGLVGLATVLSFLVLVAAPAASQGTLVSATVYVGGTPASPTWTFPLGGDAPDPPCVAEPNEVEPFEFHAEEDEFGNGDWWVTGGFISLSDDFGTWLKAELKFDGLVGTFTPGSNPGEKDLTGGGTLEADLYDISLPDDPDDPCVKNDPICTLTVDVDLITPSTYTGPQPPGPGGTLELNANSTAPHIQASLLECGLFLWVIFNGQPAFIRDLIIDL